ncbi:MAG TPA: serine/threonine-protein kinase [Rhodothermales bacterium]|nr:serine/threonine-protein kinase [Rhodothermales bacterium]
MLFNIPTSTTLWNEIAIHLEYLEGKSDAEKQEYLQQIHEQNPFLAEQLKALIQSNKWIEETFDELPMSLSSPEMWVGRQLGQFRITGLIAQGGMGQIYHAERVDGLGQQVAVKVLNQATLTPFLLDLFEREKHILASLQHPHIAYFIDAGQTQEGVPYLIMEYIAGTDLKTWCQQQNVSLEQIIPLVIQICRALQYLHFNLVVHQDIKSNNMLVDENGQIKLIDFGISSFVGVTPHIINTQYPSPLTPDYASPEQLFKQPITLSSDVYSLGVMMYDLLTGCRPFHIKGKSLDQLPFVFVQKPEKPSKRSIAFTNSKMQIDDDLDYIVLKCLAFDHKSRYQTVHDLQVDLERWLDRKPLPSLEHSLSYTFKKWTFRNRLLTFSLILLFSFLTVGTVVIWMQNVELKKRQEETQNYSWILDEALAGYNPLMSLDTQKDSTKIKQIVYSTLRLLKTLPNKSASMEGRILASLSQSAFTHGQTQLADSLIQLSEKILTGTDLNIEKAYLLHKKAQISVRRMRFKDAIVFSNEALVLIDRPKTVPYMLKFTTNHLIAMIYYLQNDLNMAKRYHRVAYNLLQNPTHLPQLSTRTRLFETAFHFYLEKEYEQSIFYAKQSIEQDEKNQLYDSTLCGTYLMISRAYKGMGKKQESYQMLQKSHHIAINYWKTESLLTKLIKTDMAALRTINTN